MNYKLSPPAKEEAARRAIPRTLIDSLMQHPQQIVPGYGGRKAYQSQFDFGAGKIYLLRAIVADDVDPVTVVTV